MFYLKKKKIRTYFGITFFTLGNEVFLFSCLHVPEWLNKIYRSSHQRCSVKRRCSQKFRKFHRKTPAPETLFQRPATLFKKSLWRRFFPVNFAKFLRAPFLQNTYCGCFWRLTLTGMTERRKSFVLKLYKYKFAQNAFCTFYVFFYMIPPHSKVSILMLFRGLLVYQQVYQSSISL